MRNITRLDSSFSFGFCSTTYSLRDPVIVKVLITRFLGLVMADA